MPKKTIFADLHNHTNASDGDYSPEELINAGREKGLSAIGITDHDTIDGVIPALKYAESIGIEVVPGVEITVRFKEDFFTGSLHFLHYFDRSLLSNESFRSALKEIFERARGDLLIRARVDEINRHFGPEGKTPYLKRPMSFEQVAAYSPNVTRRHFALALKEIHGIEDANLVNQIIGNNSPAYLPSGVELEYIKKLIHSFPVLAVLAHPAAGSYPGEGHYKEVLPPLETVEKLLPSFLDAGVRGIEIDYPGHIEAHRSILRGWKAEFDLVETGGSDCHDRHIRPIGVEGLPEDKFKTFKAALSSLGS